MDYSKKGVKNKQKELNAIGSKLTHKIIYLVIKLILAVGIGVGVCGLAFGIGLFRSILAGTPEIRISDIIATGQATMVFDNEGKKIDEYVSANANRIEVGWDKIPDNMGKAFVAIEDERFYQHNGIDYKGMVRAGYTFLKTGGDEAQGASTITQQLLKNTIFTEWMSEGNNMIKKIKRKIQEQYLAIEVTKNTDKDEILLRYMNAINLGNNTLGIESASQRYFGKSVKDLTLSECAVIAGITKNPSYYNPLIYPEHNAVRRKKCLNSMLDLGFVTQAEYDEAIADTTDVYERISYYDTKLSEAKSTNASYFSDAVYEAVLADLIDAGYTSVNAEHMLNSGGLRIYSTLDSNIQKIMDEEFRNEDNFNGHEKWYLNYALTITDDNGDKHNYSKENMTSYFKANGKSNFNLMFATQEDAYAAIDTYRAAKYAELGIKETETNYVESINITVQPQVAMVVEDQATGYVVAMEGGRGVKTGRRTLNRATNALRSPGSAFKVLAAFAPALDVAGLTLATVYNDAPFMYDTGISVQNWYTSGYRGICSIRYGVEQSLNVIAVKTLTVIGPRLGYDYLLDFGFTTLTDGVEIGGMMYTDVNQTLALGGLTYGVSPYEVTAAYAGIANQGIYNKPTLYTKVTDADGNIILDHTVPESRRVIKETTAWLLTSAMRDVCVYGGGSRAAFKGQYCVGKTGTSSDFKDSWFVGYTPYYTAAVWVGYDNATSMANSFSNTITLIAKDMWKAVMKRVHEGYEYVEYDKPEGIIEVQVCSQSGKLPVPGLCDATLRTEYFAEGTEPTETCNVHYMGDVCAYDGKIACPECPFKTYGVVTMPLPEDPALINGATVIIENEDGSQTVILPNTTNYCQHDSEFYMNPDAQSILDSQAASLGHYHNEAPSNEEFHETD